MANSCAFDSNQCASCRDCTLEAMRTQASPDLCAGFKSFYRQLRLEAFGGDKPDHLAEQATRVLVLAVSVGQAKRRDDHASRAATRADRQRRVLVDPAEKDSQHHVVESGTRISRQSSTELGSLIVNLPSRSTANCHVPSSERDCAPATAKSAQR